MRNVTSSGPIEYSPMKASSMHGAISAPNPENPNMNFLSRSRSPALVRMVDIIEFYLDNTPVTPTDTPLYIKRPIHGMAF